MDIMLQPVANLFDLPEIQVIFETLYYFSWLLMAFIVIILVLHVLFELTGSSALYVKHAPRPHWARNFYPAIVALGLLVGVVMWTLYNLSLGIVIWT